MSMGNKQIFGRDVDKWIDEYALSHQNRLNQFCHTIGIPSIVIGLLLLPIGFFWLWCLYAGVALFVIGWVFQFIGHAFEGKPPEFLKDWRFLFIGLRWWIRKIKG